MRIRRWVEAGAAVGAALAVISLADLRQFLPYAIRPSDQIDFFLCWWIALGYDAWHFSPAPFYLLVTFLNVCTYALLFLIIGIITRILVLLAKAVTKKIRGER
jgi:hypothetical protein